MICTTGDYRHYRLRFTMRHVSGKPDHQACILIFCTRPEAGGKPLDALGGIQFQVPNGGHWDYRPGQNNAGNTEFKSVTKTQFDAHQWSRVELLVDAANGTARMAVAQPPDAKAVEVVDFNVPAAGKTGPSPGRCTTAVCLTNTRRSRLKLIRKRTNSSRSARKRVITAFATGKNLGRPPTANYL